MQTGDSKIILTEKKKQKEKLLHKNDEKITQTFKEYFSTVVDKPNLYEWSL